MRNFADYKAEGRLWITLSSGEYYPDILPKACALYEPVLRSFSQFLLESASATDLFSKIALEKPAWMRIQLARIFRKYVSPETPVELLKKKKSSAKIIEDFGSGFRSIVEVQRRFAERPIPDEALCALLWEYKDRGKKGYDLTEKLFAEFRLQLPNFTFTGPERAGKDLPLGTLFPGCANALRPIDFAIYQGAELLAVGLARYDSDRGGSQEDDRPGQYRECADDILRYAKRKKLRTKVIFVNDGPGLLLGTMWNDYAAIEKRWPGRALVLTLRMVAERVTAEWLLS